MFISIRMGQTLIDLFPGVRGRMPSFSKLDGNPMFPFPGNLDRDKATVTNITLIPEGLQVEFTCVRTDGEPVKLYTKFGGAQVAVMSARVGQW